jgi:hypothetical protein
MPYPIVTRRATLLIHPIMGCIKPHAEGLAPGGAWIEVFLLWIEVIGGMTQRGESFGFFCICRSNLAEDPYSDLRFVSDEHIKYSQSDWKLAATAAAPGCTPSVMAIGSHQINPN